MTPFPRRCEILASLWLNHRGSEELTHFVDNHDLGLPLSYLIWMKMVVPSPEARKLIDLAWDELFSLCDQGHLDSPLLGNLKLALVLVRDFQEANA